jgi:uncharacterized RDD family membrane protein YckC
MYCRYCGAPSTDDLKFCKSCGKPLEIDGSVTEAPVNTSPDDVFIAGRRVARMGDRLIAVILDSLLIAAFFSAFGMWYSVERGGIREGGFSLSGIHALVVILVCLCVGLLYYWLLEGFFGATIGKAIAGVRVLKNDGSRCSLKPSLIRNIMRIVDGIAIYLVGFIVAIFSKMRRRVGDYAAGTVVVEASPRRIIQSGAIVLWLFLIFAGVAGATMIYRQASSGAPSITEIDTPSAVEQVAEEAADKITDVSPTPEVTMPVSSAGDKPSEVKVTSTGTMKLTHLDFLEKENGSSRPFAPYAPGDVVYIEYQIADFARDSESRMKVDLEAVIIDPNGLPLHYPWSKLMSQSSDGAPLNGSFSATIPAFAPPGPFVFKLSANDHIGDSKLEAIASLMVDAAAIAPADDLEIRDFVLSLSKDGEPADPLIIEGSGTIYMRCKILGIEFRDDASDLQMAFRVTGPQGNMLLDEPDFFRNQDTYEYHPPGFYLPITGHLSIPSGADKGEYTLEYIMRDNFGNNEITRSEVVEVR